MTHTRVISQRLQKISITKIFKFHYHLIELRKQERELEKTPSSPKILGRKI